MQTTIRASVLRLAASCAVLAGILACADAPTAVPTAAGTRATKAISSVQVVAIPTTSPSGHATAIVDDTLIAGWIEGGLGTHHAAKLIDGKLRRIDDVLFEQSSSANGISPTGQVVGWRDARVGKVAVVWFSYTQTDLPSLGGPYSEAFAINPSGDIVGVSERSDGTNRAVLWRDGQIADIGTLGGANAEAHAINPRGQVVGWSNTSSGAKHAFLWDRGEMIDLGTLGGTYSAAYGINARGEVVGGSSTAGGETHAFLWYRGTMLDLGTLGDRPAVAYDINSRGQVVGATLGLVPEPFVWQNGVMTDLSQPYPRGAAFAISNSGTIVGWHFALAGDMVPVMWTVK